MAGFERSVWIAASPQQVFDFVTDTEMAPKVIDGVTYMEKISPGPLAVGSQFRETRLVKGEEATTLLDVVGYEPPQRYSVASTTSGVTVTYHYTFLPEKNGAQVDLVCDVKAGGLKKALIPLVIGVMKKEDGDHLERLKTVIETG